MKHYEKIEKQMQKQEEAFKEYACKSKDAIRFFNDTVDLRPAFSRDSDRIIHSLAFTRYKDKTQVYTNTLDDNITKRITHVHYVSRAAKTISRALGVNEDLCEAIALGHDLGHTPFGHLGEKILNDISNERLNISFAHNLNSIRIVTLLEKGGKSLNLTLQVLDGIMCHNGSLPKGKYIPVTKTKEEFLQEYNECVKDETKIKELIPMTIEGCIARVSDLIGYLGKDLDDAIRLGVLAKSNIPEDIKNELGIDNATIMNSIIEDIIDNSYNKPYICFSDKMYELVFKLKIFNRENIYKKSCTDEEVAYYTMVVNKLYDYYLNSLNNENTNSSIYTKFLSNMNEEYLNNTIKEQMVIDYISTMTDGYLLREYESYIKMGGGYI